MNGVTLASASTIDKELKSDIAYGGNKDAAKAVGEAIAKRALAKGKPLTEADSSITEELRNLLTVLVKQV